MKIIRNQTLYQCSYCGKRKLTKRGCILHEDKYCWHPKSPHKIRVAKGITDKQRNCKHRNTEEIWSYIPGEAVKQPDYELCIDCGMRLG